MTGLFELGSNGNGASVSNAAALLGASDGQAFEARSRAIKSLRALTPLLIACPSAQELDSLVTRAEGKWSFKGRSGSADGTQAPLSCLQQLGLGLRQK